VLALEKDGLKLEELRSFKKLKRIQKKVNLSFKFYRPATHWAEKCEIDI